MQTIARTRSNDRFVQVPTITKPKFFIKAGHKNLQYIREVKSLEIGYQLFYLNRAHSHFYFLNRAYLRAQERCTRRENSFICNLNSEPLVY